MGLKITTELYTDAGVSSEVYINIKSIEILNKDRLVVTLNNYLNHEARETSHLNTIMCKRLFRSIGIPLKVENVIETQIPFSEEEQELIENSNVPISPQISTQIEIDYSNFEYLTSTNIYDFTYSKIKEKLIESGLEVEDL
jgi:hypothetical protein